MVKNTIIQVSLYWICLLIYSSAAGQLMIREDICQEILYQNENVINTEQLEFSPFYYRDYLGFVFSNTKSAKDTEISEYYFDLAFSAKAIDNKLTKRAQFNKNINSSYHEGPAHFDDKASVLYFTRTIFDNVKNYGRDTISRRIYKASERNDFSDVQLLSLGNEKVSACHPTLFQSRPHMIFAANYEEDSMKMDLYLAEEKSNSWSMVSALEGVNSPANEVFPFLLHDTLLFFASDRPGGLGGYDIYLSAYYQGKWEEPVALPYPFNTTFDDLGLIYNSKTNTGYFSSTRSGGQGKDDIYSFTSPEPFWVFKKHSHVVTCNIQMIDKLSLSPISNGQLKVSSLSIKGDRYNVDGFDIDILSVDKNGELLMKLTPKADEASTMTYPLNESGILTIPLIEDQKYVLHVDAPGYESTYILFKPSDDNADANIILNPVPAESVKEVVVEKPTVFVPTKIGEKAVFENIYYELNSAKILPGAAVELDALAQTMLANPTMQVELSAHTDSQGSSEYNQKLSLQRAFSAKTYLMSKGIISGRIRALGYGESQIRNQCTDGVKCTDEEHKYNRRTEVTVIKE